MVNFRGADLHVAVDCNFHRHNKSASDSPKFYDPNFFLPKDEVDLVGSNIDDLRRKGPRKYSPKIPDVVVEEDEKSFEAAGENNEKAGGKQHDNKGLAALVCRHDNPIFFANVDTPGEQQKYAVALIIRFFQLIPEDATVVLIYDIGCVLDRSNEMVSF